MIRTIAIDDEPLALRQLASYIDQNPSLECVGLFDNGEDACLWLEENDADLAFSDINMAEMSGVEFAERCHKKLMIIFTTAYSDYAIYGYKYGVLDFLLKPFSLADFSRAVRKANLVFEHLVKGVREQIEPKESTFDDDFISIKADYKIHRIPLSQISHVASEGEYVRVFMEGGNSILTLTRLKNMESALPASRFMRVHRSYIVSLSQIKEYAKGKVELLSGEIIPVGDIYKEPFTKRIVL